MEDAATQSRDDSKTEESSSSSGSHNELTTAKSYYNLYQHSSFSSHTNRTTTTSKQRRTIMENDDDNDKFWVEDEWTKQDFQNAETLLKNAQERYDTSSMATSTSQIKSQKYEQQAAKKWDYFYQCHKTRFFNDRHYLHKAFPEEFAKDRRHHRGNDVVVVVEIGCGVGNAILPLLELHHPCYEVWGLDFSQTAIDLLRRDERFVKAAAEGRAHAHVWDITCTDHDKTPSSTFCEVADVSMLLFCLSAIHPDKMVHAVQNAASTLRAGGTLVFRDYGRYDQAQLKLGTSRGKRLSDNFYVKHDGTRCYYFDLEDLKRLFVHHAGLQVLELRYIRRMYNNRAKSEQRRRVWVQARLQKPLR